MLQSSPTATVKPNSCSVRFAVCSLQFPVCVRLLPASYCELVVGLVYGISFTFAEKFYFRIGRSAATAASSATAFILYVAHACIAVFKARLKVLLIIRAYRYLSEVEIAFKSERERMTSLLSKLEPPLHEHICKRTIALQLCMKPLFAQQLRFSFMFPIFCSNSAE